MARRRVRLRVVGPLVLLAVGASGCGLASDSPEQRDLARAEVAQASGKLRQSNSRNRSAILSATDMKPGETAAGEVTIANTGTVAGAFFLSTSNISEAAGASGGRLSDRLALEVQDVTRRSRPVGLYSGALTSMGRTAVGALAPKARRRYRFSVSFSSASADAGVDDNSYQTSSVRLQFDWTAKAVTRLRTQLGARPIQRLGRRRVITLTARCGRPCTVTATATLPARRVRTRVKGRVVSRVRKPVRLGKVRRRGVGAKRKRITLRLTRRGLAALRGAAEGSRPVRVIITVVARDSLRMTTTTKRVVKVALPR